MCIWVCVCIWTCVLEMVENLDVDIICDHFNYIACKYLILWYIKGNTSFSFIGGGEGVAFRETNCFFLKILRKIERWQSTTSNNHKQSRSQQRLNSEQVWNGKIWTEIETGKLWIFWFLGKKRGDGGRVLRWWNI